MLLLQVVQTVYSLIFGIAEQIPLCSTYVSTTMQVATPMCASNRSLPLLYLIAAPPSHGPQNNVSKRMAAYARAYGFAEVSVIGNPHQRFPAVPSEIHSHEFIGARPNLVLGRHGVVSTAICTCTALSKRGSCMFFTTFTYLTTTECLISASAWRDAICECKASFQALDYGT